eukprot:jgi/Mesvir1/17833/Mv12924-RA.1
MASLLCTTPMQSLYLGRQLLRKPDCPRGRGTPSEKCLAIRRPIKCSMDSGSGYDGEDAGKRLSEHLRSNPIAAFLAFPRAALGALSIAVEPDDLAANVSEARDKVSMLIQDPRPPQEKVGDAIEVLEEGFLKLLLRGEETEAKFLGGDVAPRSSTGGVVGMASLPAAGRYSDGGGSSTASAAEAAPVVPLSPEEEARVITNRQISAEIQDIAVKIVELREDLLEMAAAPADKMAIMRTRELSQRLKRRLAEVEAGHQWGGDDGAALREALEDVKMLVNDLDGLVP